MYNSGTSLEVNTHFLWTSSETHLSPGIGGITDTGDIGDFKILNTLILSSRTLPFGNIELIFYEGFTCSDDI